MSKEVLKEGFEFLQPIIDAGINFPFEWKEEYKGYRDFKSNKILMSDGKLYCQPTLKVIIRGEKVTYNNSNQPEPFDVDEFIKYELAPKIIK